MIAPRNVLGDQKQRIKAIIMHSKPHGDLEADQVGILVGGVANVTIYSGGIGSFGLPVIVTDSDNLVVADAGGVGIDGYYSMFLTEDAATLTESEQPLIREQDVLKLEQITKVIQGEHAFNLGLKGFTWDETNGGPSPTDAALTTGTNWDKKYADDKSLGGSIWLTL
jgi:small ligand-binding sensory domain FIST